MGIEISSGGVSKKYRYYPYDAFYVDANGNVNTSGNGQQVKEAWFNGVKYYPDGAKPPARIAIIRKPTLSDYSDIVVQAYTVDNEVWYNEAYPNGLIPFNELSINKIQNRYNEDFHTYFPNGLPPLGRATNRVRVRRNWSDFDWTEINGGRDFRIYTIGLFDEPLNRLCIIPYLVVNRNSYPLNSVIPKGTYIYTKTEGYYPIFLLYHPSKYDATLRGEGAYRYNNEALWYRVGLVNHNTSMGDYLNDNDLINHIIDGGVNTFTTSNGTVIENIPIYIVNGISNYLFYSINSHSYEDGPLIAMIGMMSDLTVSWRPPNSSTSLSTSCCSGIDIPFQLEW